MTEADAKLEDRDARRLSKTEQRRGEIMRLLLDHPSMQIRDLTVQLGVSLMTIHRDLSELQNQGLVRRLRGSVSAEKSMLFESSYLYRSHQHVSDKRRLARAAVAHIEPGNAVIWDDSSTTFHVTEFIEEVVPLTIITNALPVLEKLRDAPDIELIALGGKYHRSYNGFFGLACERAIRSYQVDVALLSTTTIQGLSMFTQDEQVVQAKQAMLSIARKKILLADESKFHFSALNHVASLLVFDAVLLPIDTDEAIVAELKEGGVRLQLV